MTGATDPSTLTFETVWKYLHPDRKFIGPRPPVSDYRFAAGLLFKRFNDHSDRILKNKGYHCPFIEVSWYRDFSGCVGYAKVFITKEVLDRLQDEYLVEGTPQWGYTDKTELRLSNKGKRFVVEEWFIEGCEITDLLLAGARINPGEGKVRW